MLTRSCLKGELCLLHLLLSATIKKKWQSTRQRALLYVSKTMDLKRSKSKRGREEGGGGGVGEYTLTRSERGRCDWGKWRWLEGLKRGDELNTTDTLNSTTAAFLLNRRDLGQGQQAVQYSAAHTPEAVRGGGSRDAISSSRHPTLSPSGTPVSSHSSETTAYATRSNETWLINVLFFLENPVSPK